MPSTKYTIQKAILAFLKIHKRGCRMIECVDYCVEAGHPHRPNIYASFRRLARNGKIDIYRQGRTKFIRKAPRIPKIALR